MNSRVKAAGCMWKTIAVVLLAITLALPAVAQETDVKGATGREWADGLVNTASGQIQVSMAHPLGWLLALLVKNPKVYPLDDPDTTGAVKVILPMMTSILMPLWYMLILLNGIFFIWGSRDPASRSAAKQRMIRLMFGMIICSLAAPIFQLILEIQRSLTIQVLGAADITADEMVGGYIRGAEVLTLVVLILVKLLVVSWGTALCPILLLILAPFMAIGARYVAVIVLALLFPLTIFLYFFDSTKKLGSKLFRTSMMWISVPIVQAILVVVMLKGVQAAERVNLVGGFVALACFVLMGIVPLKMEDMMKSIGGALIHSGYTTSNPRLVMLGAAVSGQGPAAFSDFAWYASMGMQRPAGGSEVEKQWGTGLKSPPAAYGYMRKGEMAEERRQIDARIKEALHKKDTVPAVGVGAEAVKRRSSALDREIAVLYGTRNLTSIAHISGGERRLAEKENSFNGVRSVLDRHQTYRLMKEQELAKKYGIPVKGFDLTQHKARVTFAYATAPFAPGEILRPAGAFLSGLMTHIISPDLPLGKSLMGKVKKMTPTVEIRDVGGEKVKVTKEEWKNWWEVGKSALKPAGFIAGVSLLSIAGLPVLAGAAAVGLSMKGIRGAVEKDKEVEKNFENLGKNPARLKEIRKLAGKERAGTLSDSERKEAGKISMEFGGMKPGGIVKKHETGKLARSRELETLIQTSKQRSPKKEETARVDELAKTFGLATGAPALTTIMNEHVNPERKKLQKDEIYELEKLGSVEGAVRLMSLSGAQPLTVQEKNRKEALEKKGLDAPLEREELRAKEKLDEKAERWDENKCLSPIFGLEPGSGVELAAKVAGESSTLRYGLEEYRRNIEPGVEYTRELADPKSQARMNMEDTAGQMDVKDLEGLSDMDKLKRDGSLLSYADSLQARDELRLDTLMEHDYKNAETPEERDDLNEKYKKEIEKYVKRYGKDEVKDLGDVISKKEEEYKHGINAFGITTDVVDENGRNKGKLEQLSGEVHRGLGLGEGEDERYYSRYSILLDKSGINEAEKYELMNRDAYHDERTYERHSHIFNKILRDSSLQESEKMEARDLDAHMHFSRTEKRTGLEESVAFRASQLKESERARKTLRISEYAAGMGTGDDILQQLEDDAKKEATGVAVDTDGYTDDLKAFGINPADKDALQQLYDTINESKDFNAMKNLKKIDEILK